MKKEYLWVVLAFAAFTAMVIISGLGFNPTGADWNFNNTGQFGDSFGPLSSIFACVAAVSAFLAYSEQRAELRRVEGAYDEEKFRAEKRDFENTFFHLMGMKREALSAIEISNGLSGIRGPAAVDEIIRGIEYSDSDSEFLSRSYASYYYLYRNSLSTYLRTCYHVIKFVDDEKFKDKKTYARIFRASLSNSEIVLIGINAVVGGGQRKFKPLIEKYALLHNISASDADYFDLLPKFKKGAFGRRDIAEEIAAGADVINKD